MQSAILQAMPDLQLDMAAISSLMADPDGFAFDSIIGNNPLTLGGVPVTREVAMSMVVVPDAWQTIINAVKVVNQDLAINTVYNYQYKGTSGGPLTPRLAMSNIQIANNSFSLTTAYTAGLNNKYSVYTTSDKQNAINTALN